MRLAAFLVLVAAAAATYALFNLPAITGGMYTIDGVAALVAGALLIAFAVVSALILWGFADGLILLADLDDAQRLVRSELSDLVLLQRTQRGPFHAEAVASKKGEETRAG